MEHPYEILEGDQTLSDGKTIRRKMIFETATGVTWYLSHKAAVWVMPGMRFGDEQIAKIYSVDLHCTSSAHLTKDRLIFRHSPSEAEIADAHKEYREDPMNEDYHSVLIVGGAYVLHVEIMCPCCTQS